MESSSLLDESSLDPSSSSSWSETNIFSGHRALEGNQTFIVNNGGSEVTRCRGEALVLVVGVKSASVPLLADETATMWVVASKFCNVFVFCMAMDEFRINTTIRTGEGLRRESTSWSEEVGRRQQLWDVIFHRPQLVLLCFPQNMRSENVQRTTSLERKSCG